jgi:fimbrial chaperone protein
VRSDYASCRDVAKGSVVKRLKNKAFAWAVAVFALLGISAGVYAMTVQPVVIDLTTSGRGMSQVLTVENTFDRPLPVETRAEELALTADGVAATGRDPGDLAIFPPQALIQPGQRQTFRVQYVGDPALAKSKHYYVTVAQLPVRLGEGESNIQLLYNFQVLVSVSPDGAKPALAIAGAEPAQGPNGAPAAAITVNNPSATHGYLSRGRLRIVQYDASGKEVFGKTMSGPEIQQTVGYGLIGAGQTRRVIVPVELPQQGGRIEAQFTPDN